MEDCGADIVWKYKEYKSSNGTRPVENWYEKLPHQDRARVKAFLFRIKLTLSSPWHLFGIYFASMQFDLQKGHF